MRVGHVRACAAIAGLLVAVTLVSHAVEPALEDLASFPSTVVEVRATNGIHRFRAWVADTPSRQAQGLMFVRDLAPDAGMLFVSRAPRIISMWMKNTYVSLDMLFVGESGRIVSIAANTNPHSVATVSSGVPAIAVLEIRGGEAERRGIRVGDRVVWKDISAP